jgi:hypothetical protein
MGEPSASSSTPFTVFDYLGLGFILEPPGVVVHAVMTGEPLKLENAWYALPFIFIGAICIYIGRKWDQRKPGFNTRFVSAIDKLNKSYLVPFVLLVMFLGGVAVIPLLVWPPNRAAIEPQTKTVIIHEPPSSEDIAKATASVVAERNDLLNKLSAVTRERDAARQWLVKSNMPGVMSDAEQIVQIVYQMNARVPKLTQGVQWALLITAPPENKGIVNLLITLLDTTRVSYTLLQMPDREQNLDVPDLTAKSIPGITLHGENEFNTTLRAALSGFFDVHTTAQTSEWLDGYTKPFLGKEQKAIWIEIGPGSPRKGEH